MGRNERILGVQFQGKFGKWVKRAFFARSHVIVQLLSGEQEKRWADTAEVWREQNDKECLVKHSHECNHPHFKILDSRIWGEMTRSSWVSLFVDDLVEFDKYCIRQQDPNIYSDTAQGEVPCLGWRGAVGSLQEMKVRSASLCLKSNLALSPSNVTAAYAQNTATLFYSS